MIVLREHPSVCMREFILVILLLLVCVNFCITGAKGFCFFLLSSTGAQQKISGIINIWVHEFELMEQLESKFVTFMLKSLSLKFHYIQLFL